MKITDNALQMIQSGLAGIFFLVLCHSLLPYDLNSSISDITPQPEIQSIISRGVAAQTEKEKKDVIYKLQDMLKKNHEMVVPQIIFFGNKANTEREGMFMMVLQYELSLGAWPSFLRPSLIRLLETKDKPVQKAACLWLFNLDVGYDDPLDQLKEYRKVLIGNKENPLPGMVNYLFDYLPGRALLLFGDIYLEGERTKPLVWAEHVIRTDLWRKRNGFLQASDSDRIHKELDAMSKHEGWYARRYVVSILRREPYYWTPEIEKRLKADLNPLVREAISSIKE